MSGHTPAPWRVDPDYPGRYGIVGSGRFVCRVGGAGTLTTEDEANARLIRAAPDLLEALEFALGYPSDEGDECVAKMRAAVAKATGEAQP